jgi:drug/metabolite transporter (DMT)-like permease
MSSTEPPNRILFYYHAGGAIIFLIPTIILWQNPVGIEWALLAGIGVMTTIGMTGFIRAFSVGEANAVGPMEYVRLIYAGVLGYSIFGEVPDYWTYAGALIIIIATLYIARDEAKGQRG